MLKKLLWKIAQENEKEWWLKWKHRTAPETAKTSMRKKAEEIERIIGNFLSYNPRIRILQIGPGPDGEINCLKGERYAVDPLSTYYKKNFPELLDKAVDYRDGYGEELIFEDAFFDVILAINVLDHCLDPKRVAAEINRCLRPGGLIIIANNVYGGLTAKLHALGVFLDREHPHALTRQTIKRMLPDNYTIIDEESWELPAPAWNRIKSMVFHLLNILGLGPCRYRLVAKKFTGLYTWKLRGPRQTF